MTWATFFGEDRNNSSSVQPSSLPNSTAASTSFGNRMIGVRTENFESYSSGTSAGTSGLAISFTGSGSTTITATLTGQGQILTNDPGYSNLGRYSVPGGTHYWSTNATATGSGAAGPCAITTNVPIRAFAFWATDVGDYGGQLAVSVYNGSTLLQTLYPPHSIGSSASTDGSCFFFGFIADADFNKVVFSSSYVGSDVFGYDSFTIADVNQIRSGAALASADGTKPDGRAPLLSGLWGARYMSSMVISTASDPRSSMGELITAMAGRHGWAGGIWRVKAGHMPATVFAMDQSWLTKKLQTDGTPENGPTLTISNGIPREQKVNRVTGSCVDPNQRYQVLPFPAVSDATRIASEGAEYVLDVQYQAAYDPLHAQYLSMIAIKKAAAPLRMQSSCNMRAYTVELFDTGTLTLPAYGISNKTMEVVGWRWAPADGPQINLSEITQAIYDLDTALTGVDPAPNSNLPSPWVVETPTSVAVTSGTVTLTDGSVLTRTRIAWDPAVAQAVRVGGRAEVQYAEVTSAAEGAWQVWEEDGASTAAIIPALKTNSFYVFRVRFVTAAPLRVRGKWSAQVLAQIATQSAGSGSVLSTTIDQYDFAGTTYSGTGLTARTVTITPAADCVIDFQAKVTAENVNPDAGNQISWTATPSGGSAVTMGFCEKIISSTPTEVTATNVIAAAGGVPIDFKLAINSPSSNPHVTVFTSYIRLLVIKS